MGTEGPITGEFPPETERGANLRGIGHSTGFELALVNALEGWNPGDPTTMRVTLEIDIKENPGGVGTYRIRLNPAP